jgi:hypothetical protein
LIVRPAPLQARIYIVRKDLPAAFGGVPAQFVELHLSALTVLLTRA